MKLNWGNSIVIFFILFLSLAIFFIIFSLRQNNDLVSSDYYEQGANYTSQMKINNRSAVFQDSIQIKNRDKSIDIQINSGIIKMADSLNICFFRPSDKRQDYTINIKCDTSAIHLDKKNFIQGRYLVKFSWKSNGEKYLITKDFDVIK